MGELLTLVKDVPCAPHQVGSVYGMTPGSPLVTALAPAPLAPGVTGHSIIAVKGDGPLDQETDGVVAYSSAHLEGMASELVVTSGHSVQPKRCS